MTTGPGTGPDVEMAAQESPSVDGSGWLHCYVPDCDREVTERLRLHVGAHPSQEVLACAHHAAILRMVAL